MPLNCTRSPSGTFTMPPTACAGAALAAGIALGVLFGMVPFHFSGIPVPVKLGIAGGPLSSRWRRNASIRSTSQAVADYTMGLMIAVARRIVEYDRVVRSGGWTDWPLMSMVATRDGEDEVQPQGAIFGPKVMLINETAGSGGDAMPWYFRKAGVGPLIGTRTWGGEIWLSSDNFLVDGGIATAAEYGVYGPEGAWTVTAVGAVTIAPPAAPPAAARRRRPRRDA